jgi:hypothetical protein
MINMVITKKKRKVNFSPEEFLLDSSHKDIISLFQVCFQDIGKHLIKHIQD